MLRGCTDLGRTFRAAILETVIENDGAGTGAAEIWLQQTIEQVRPECHQLL